MRNLVKFFGLRVSLKVKLVVVCCSNLLKIAVLNPTYFICFIYFSENPFKNDEKCFCFFVVAVFFHLKSFFRPHDF